MKCVRLIAHQKKKISQEDQPVTGVQACTLQIHLGLFLLLHLGLRDLQRGTTAPGLSGPLCPVNWRQLAGAQSL